MKSLITNSKNKLNKTKKGNIKKVKTGLMHTTVYYTNGNKEVFKNNDWNIF